MALQSKVIIIVGHDASLTGAPKSLLLIANIFKENGYSLVFILGKDGPLLPKYKQLGTTYIWHKDLSNADLLTKISFRVKGGKEKYEEGIIKIISKLNIHFIFNNTVVNGAIIEKLLPIQKTIISRIPELESVIQFYNTDSGNSLKVLKNSTRIIAVSEAVKKNLIQNHQLLANKIDVVYGTIPQRSTQLPVNNTKIFTVVSCGTLILRKGLDVFLNVAKKCREELGEKSIRFLWIGGDKNSLGYFEIKEDIRKLGLEDCIEITGQTANTEQFYAQSNVFLLCSREDPFPLVMLEAAQMNLPVIAFQQGGGAEEFIDSSLGFCLPYLDSDAMTNAILKLYKDPVLLKSMGTAAFEKSKEYTPERTKKDILTILENLVDEKP